MKILNVIMSLDRESGGGAVNRIAELSLFLAKKKHLCTILTTKKNLNSKIQNSITQSILINP